MAKRRADKELNHDNWDEDYVSESAGTFRRANTEQLQDRVMRKARRRGVTEKDAPKNVFSGFGSLVSTKMPQADFSFLKNFQAKSNGTSGTTEIQPIKAAFGSSNAVEKKEAPGEKEDSEYLSSLKALNVSFLEWIKKHLDTDPYCILTPPFEDYKKHLNILKEKKIKTSERKSCETTPSFGNPSEKTKTTIPTLSSNKSSESSKPTFAFNSSSEDKPKPFSPLSSDKPQTQATTESKPAFTFGAASPKFSFGVTSDSSKETPKFGFGSGTSAEGEKESKPLFSFQSTFPSSNMSTGFSFGTIPKAQPVAKPEGEDDDEDEPPKVDVTPVVEDSAVYSIRCKLFFKKDGTFKDKGVGMLHLKPADSKTQLVIRADTNLGNILLNIILQSDLPIQRIGKNNVMIMCVPNPPLNPKSPDKEPIPMLIRVKDDKDADKLKEKLDELKA